MRRDQAGAAAADMRGRRRSGRGAADSKSLVLTELDNDVILYIAAAEASPLSDHHSIIPRLSRACKQLAALLQPTLKELRKAVLAVRALGALKVPLGVLRARCLHVASSTDGCFLDYFDPALRNEEKHCDRENQVPRDKAERHLAALLPSTLPHLPPRACMSPGASSLLVT